jgi:hypothetical protein
VEFSPPSAQELELVGGAHPKESGA